MVISTSAIDYTNISVLFEKNCCVLNLGAGQRHCDICISSRRTSTREQILECFREKTGCVFVESALSWTVEVVMMKHHLLIFFGTLKANGN